MCALFDVYRFMLIMIPSLLYMYSVNSTVRLHTVIDSLRPAKPESRTISYSSSPKKTWMAVSYEGLYTICPP